MRADVEGARSFLFVPGHRPDRFAKAAESGTDIVILDLEDAVAAERKAEARGHVRDWLSVGNRAVVRINAAETPWHRNDVSMLSAVGARAVMVPKTESPESCDAVARSLPEGAAVIPLLETAAGIVRATDICAATSVVRPAFGSVDLAAQLGVDHRSHEALRQARSTVVLAAAAASSAAPIDGVTTSLGDDRALLADLDHATTLGYLAKLCVHPRQVPTVNEAFTPDVKQIEWAQQVLGAVATGSVTIHEGQMIDRPEMLRAQAILARVPKLRAATTAGTADIPAT